MTDNLSPCPFCGEPALKWKRRDIDNGCCADGDCPGHGVVCTVDEWNRRADTPKVNVVATFAPTHRHKKRGSTYQVIATGRLQVDGDLDMEKVTVYQGEDGQVWVRPDYEFNDGRFEVLATEGKV